MNDYRVIKGLLPPEGREPRRTRLGPLIELAQSMEVYDAALMTCAEAQTFRIILAALGFGCVEDGRHAPRRTGSGLTKTLVFKLPPPNTQPPIDYSI